MTNGTRLFNAVLLIVLIAICIYIGRTCNCNGVKPTRSDTISVKRDTMWLPQDTFISYVPQPYKVVSTVTKWKTDTLETFEYIQPDTSLLYADYAAIRYYRDTLKLVDSLGFIISYDTVQHNRIKGKGVEASINKVTIRETITLRDRRTIAFIGLEALGNQNNYLFAAGMNFSLKTKNDKIFELKALLSKSGQPLYGIGYRIPIRLK